MHGGAEVVEVGVLRDDAHQAAHRAGAIQRALRSAQHFDVIDVEHPRIDRVRQRRVIDVEAGDVVARDAADRHGARGADAVAGRRERQIGHLGGVIEEGVDGLLFEAGAPKVVIDIGTFCSLSERFCAVTVMSSSEPALVVSAAEPAVVAPAARAAEPVPSTRTAVPTQTPGVMRRRKITVPLDAPMCISISP